MPTSKLPTVNMVASLAHFARPAAKAPPLLLGCMGFCEICNEVITRFLLCSIAPRASASVGALGGEG